MPVLHVSADDQYLVASGDTPLLEIYDALPQNLYPPFAPVELPGGVGELLARGGFGQTFFFAADILGLIFLTPSGKRVEAGGKVVKNVQGYDLVRPFVGSFGLLGQALEVTLRLRPGRTAAIWRYQQKGEINPRFVWEEKGEKLAYHFGHPRELARAGFLEELRLDPERDYRGYFPDGMGVGEKGPLTDLRFTWSNGGRLPEPNYYFVRLAEYLDGRKK